MPSPAMSTAPRTAPPPSKSNSKPAGRPPAAPRTAPPAAANGCPASYQGDAVAACPKVEIEEGLVEGCGQKIVIYGPGGIGKSELCSLLPEVGINGLYVDLEDSSKFLDVKRARLATWDATRGFLHQYDVLSQFGAIIVESLTKAEELSAEWTKANIPTDKGKFVKRIEDYGFGKGFTHNYETFLNLLGDLDAIARRGIHVICTCHDCTCEVPNPQGENWLQYQPRLQSPPKTGKVRERVKEWADHLFYIGWDKEVDEDKKAIGSGSRTIYVSERPTHWAKSRTLRDNLAYPQYDASLWKSLFGTAE